MKKLALIAALSLLFVSSSASAQVRYVPAVRVTVAPPALRAEAVIVAPSPRHVWVAGHWAWRGGAHVWRPGHWTLPPGSGYAWEPARWESGNGAWTYSEGYWHPNEAPDANYAYQPAPPPVTQVVVDTPPPEPFVEVRPATPFEGAYWMPGYWNWNGYRHVWVVGRWTQRPAGHGWEEHRWERRQDGRWMHQPGHWHPHGERERWEHEHREHRERGEHEHRERGEH